MGVRKLGTVKATGGEEIGVCLSEPNGAEPKDMTKEDVWGEWVDEGVEEHKDPDGFKYNSSKGHFKGGMLVARGHGHKDRPQTVCPIFKDEVPWKSVTAICALGMEEKVTYWLEYVHGSNSISKRKVLPGGRVALRSDYMCW